METKLRPWMTVVVASLWLVGLGLGLARAPQPACEGAEPALEGLWNEPRREAMRQAFLATREPYAEASWRTVDKGLEHYTRAWVDLRREACQATHVRGEQSEEVLALRLQCLERRRQELKSLTEVLSEVNARELAQVDRVLERLVPLESCASPASLATRAGPPQEPAVRARVEELQGRLAQVRALFVAGHVTRGLEQGTALVEQVEATGYRPLIAETWLLLARLQYQSSDGSAAVESARRAARVFLASGQHEEELQARLVLVSALQLQGKPAAEEQEKWLRYLEKSLLAAGNPPTLRADYERRLAHLRSHQGRYTEGLEHARRAVVLLERLHGPDSPQVASALLEQLRAGALLGQYEEALAAGQRALTYWKSTLGLEHPSTLRVLALIGVIQASTWQLADSAATYEQVLSLLRRKPDTDPYELVPALNNLAVVYIEQGRHPEGEALLEQALSTLEEHGMRQSIHGVICLQSLAESKSLRGQHAEALRLARQALALAEKTMSPQHLALAVVLTTVGEAEQEAGSTARARAALERALTLLEAVPAHPKERGHARFALARVLWATGGDRARLRTLLEQARQDFDEAGASSTRLRATWDAWVRARGLELTARRE